LNEDKQWVRDSITYQNYVLPLSSEPPPGLVVSQIGEQFGRKIKLFEQISSFDFGTQTPIDLVARISNTDQGTMGKTIMTEQD